MPDPLTRPVASSDVVRRRMERQRRRDTQPELRLRRELHRLGLRYRVDRPVAPGVRRRADIVFGGAKVVVFVDGCFWHHCSIHGTMPKANAAWWQEKLEGNVRRDRQTDDALVEAGWLVVRVWEHEEPTVVADTVADIVSSRRRSRGGAGGVLRAGDP